jgi:urea transport system permease protein
MAFLSAAVVGAVLERSVLRFLYGRPLETLLRRMGHQFDIDANGAQSVWGAKCGCGKPPLDERWHTGLVQPQSCLGIELLIVAFALTGIAGHGIARSVKHVWVCLSEA